MKLTPLPCFLLSLICVLGLLPRASAQNLLQNGDFSKDWTGWTTNKVVGTITPDAVCKVEIATDGSRKSGKVAHISDTDPTAGISFSQKIPASEGKSYELAYSSKTSSPGKGSPGYAMIQFLDKKGAWLNNPEAAGPNGTPTPEELKTIKRDAGSLGLPGKGWNDVSFSATAPVGTAYVNIMFKAGNGGTGEIDVSDVSLTQK